MSHRFSDLIEEAVPLGTVFTVLNQIWNGTDEEENSNLWHVPIGAPAGTGVGSCIQLTNATIGVFGFGLQEFYFYGIPSPDRSKILARFSKDIGPNRHLVVMNADGSGITVVNAVNNTENPCWVGNNLLAFQDASDNTTLKTVNADGTGKTTILTKVGGISGHHASPDGSKIAYVANVGGNTQLGVCDPDGSNDTVLVASGVTAGAFPAWTLDGTQIVFSFGVGLDIIGASGTGQTTIAASLFGFYYPAGMGQDRFFYTNTSDVTNWRPARAMLDGSGDAIITPSHRVSQSTQRGVCVWDDAQGRMFSVLHRSDPASTGEDAVFSILPDGSDFRIHFVALEEPFVNPGDNFQLLSFR